jgi:hypothetical protein
MAKFVQLTCNVQTESVAEKMAPIARKSPTSSVPMFILLNIAMAAEIKKLIRVRISEVQKVTRNNRK